MVPSYPEGRNCVPRKVHIVTIISEIPINLFYINMHVSTYVISKQLQFRISLISKLVKKKLIHRECAKKELNMGNNAEIDPTFKDSIPHPMRKHKTEVIVDPEWEEEVPTYDPTAVAKERPVLRLMQNMTRKERIEGRMAERERLRSLEVLHARLQLS